MDGKGHDTVSSRAASSTIIAGSPPSTSFTRSSSGSAKQEGTWWRWTHGKSGSISSSSDGLSDFASVSHSTSSFGYHVKNDLSSAQKDVPTWDTMRWQKRTSRTGLIPREEDIKSSAQLGSSSKSGVMATPFVGSSSASYRTASGLSRKKSAPSSSKAARENCVKRRFSSSITSNGLSYSSETYGSSSESSSHDRGSLDTEIRWTLGPGKRKVTKKDKKFGHTTPRVSSSVSSRRSLRSSLDSKRSSEVETLIGVDIDVHMLEEKQLRCFSPTSTASTTSSSASFFSSSFVRPDPVVSCARALLEDCRRQRYGQTTALRKRTLDERNKTEIPASQRYSCFDGLSKSPGGSGHSCGSNSSDDELSLLSSIELSHQGLDASDRDSDCKVSREELVRQLMLAEHELSSSPDFECLSPLSVEKGIPVEIRYQLPLALGTANETDKECTICQVRYGIGDHIYTLPCQHFFHASCVDRWLTSHTSCPLCRTEVPIDTTVEPFTPKYDFSECPVSDQESYRRRMQSSSRSIGFRPVIPEVDQLHNDIATLRIFDESDDSSQGEYLVCPTPQRPPRK